jgi:hypothetical protein
MADRRLREPGIRHQVADADLVSPGELVDDREPCGIAERLEAIGQSARDRGGRRRAGRAAGVGVEDVERVLH